MAKRKQTINNNLPQLDLAELQAQQEAQAKAVLDAVLDPIKKTIEAMATAITANTKAIESLAEQKSQSIIPPEIQKHIPDIINGLINWLTKPEPTEVAAAQKWFGDETLEKAFKDSLMQQWTTNNKLLEANLDKINLDISIAKKHLTGEYF